MRHCNPGTPHSPPVSQARNPSSNGQRIPADRRVNTVSSDRHRSGLQEYE
jgi:hypothetical protein